MVIQAALKLYTVADLANLPDDGKRYELVRGELIELSPIKRTHGLLTTFLITLLNNYVVAHGLGEVNNEVGYLLATNPDTLRAPDIAFIAKERMPPLTDDYIDVAPDLAIEVILPSNSADEMNEKIADYFAAGVKQVWLVYPKTRTIQVYRSPKHITGLDVADRLEGGTILPGFGVPVSDIFAVLSPTAHS